MEPDRIVGSDKRDKVFMRNQDVVSRRIAGELFLIPVRGKIADMEKIFTLSAVAEYIWERLDGQKTQNEILRDVMANFDVEQERAESDMRELIMELSGAGLISEERT